jgi:ubiquinone biosynthesis monooxygenase Coq6
MLSRSSVRLWNTYLSQTRYGLRRTYAQVNTHPEIYDVVCVGGGPAGLSLLAALSIHILLLGFCRCTNQ